MAPARFRQRFPIKTHGRLQSAQLGSNNVPGNNTVYFHAGTTRFEGGSQFGGLKPSASLGAAQGHKAIQGEGDRSANGITLSAKESNKIDRTFDDTKFKIGKHTKDMVEKIFKAAHHGDQQQLDHLFEQVEARARQMLTMDKLSDLPMQY